MKELTQAEKIYYIDIVGRTLSNYRNTIEDIILDELEMFIIQNEDDWCRKPQVMFNSFKERLNK